MELRTLADQPELRRDATESVGHTTELGGVFAQLTGRAGVQSVHDSRESRHHFNGIMQFLAARIERVRSNIDRSGSANRRR